MSGKFPAAQDGNIRAAVSKSVELANGGEVTMRGDWSYRSGAFMDALNSPELFQAAYSLVNTNLTYDFPGKKISIFGAITNIADKQYLQTGVYGSSFGLYEHLYARPREWSVGIKWSF